MGGVKRVYEEEQLKNKLNEHLITVDDDELLGLLKEYIDVIFKNKLNSSVSHFENMGEELVRLSKEESIFLKFTSQINELKKSMVKDNSSLNLKMHYSFAVTLMESCLGDMLKHVILSESVFLINAIKNVKELSVKRVSLLDVYEIEDLVNKSVLSTLSDYIYHNVEKIVPIYRCVLGVELPEDIKNKVGEMAKIVAIRHDIVHRNGFDKVGNEHNLTIESLNVAIKNIIDFVQSMHVYIETTKETLPF
ncbi:hypothetical protein [Pectobacterium carotovorum]|uniref:hypothetical protein n=1 Tax=Pectobacterium carotovorum TaxID=554 RepID=UPI002B241E4B|nr:hypothetical protein [Pectobacterium carotovorum]